MENETSLCAIVCTLHVQIIDVRIYRSESPYLVNQIYKGSS